MTTIPQVRIFQELTPLPAGVLNVNRAAILGPHNAVRTYEKARSQIGVGTYDESADEIHSYPSREAGEVVDQDTVTVTIEQGSVEYFNQIDGAGAIVTAPSPVLLEIAGVTGWSAIDSFSRNPDIPRDVAVGDEVVVTDPDNVNDTLTTTVRGLVREVTASSIAATTADAGNRVTTATSISAVNSTPAVVPTDGALVINSDSYDGSVDGQATESYTLTVSKGGDYDVAEITILSASGTDDVYDAVISDGVAIVSDKGMIFTFGTGIAAPEADKFQVGIEWTVSITQSIFTAVAAPTQAGTYTGPSDATYIIEVSRGGTMSSDPATGAQVTVSTNTGIDQSGPHLADPAGPFAIGSFGVTVDFVPGQLNKGDRYYVVATAEGQGRISRLQLADNMSAAMEASDGLSVQVRAVRDVSVTEDRYNAPGLVNFETDANEVTLKAGITFYSATETDLNGFPVIGGDAFVGYIALDPSFVNETIAVSDVSELDAYFDDLTPDNPLGFGMKKALENSGGTIVYGLAVASDDLAGYTAALDETLEYENIYSLTPLTDDIAIQNLIIGHVQAQSTPEKGRWRIAWLTQHTVSEEAIVDEEINGSVVLATIDDNPGDAVGTYRRLTAAAGLFLDRGVRPGDEVRYSFAPDAFGNPTYKTDVVDTVSSQTEVILFGGADAEVVVASKIEIIRDLTVDEQVDGLIATKPVSDRRFYLLPSDNNDSLDGFDGLPGYYAACAWAGLRAGSAPHQGLTNAEINGITDIPFLTKLTNTIQRERLMNAGYWLTVRDRGTGEIFCFKQVSTDPTDINTTEQSVTTNLDSISYFFKSILEPYIGRTNNVQTVHNLIRADLESGIETLINQANTPTLGGQLITATIAELRPHATLADRLVIRMPVDLPEPLNNVDLTLVV